MFEFAGDDGAGAVVTAALADAGLAGVVAPVAAGIDSGEVMTGSGI